MSTFVHLHCHTEYSLLDGAIRLRDLCVRAQSEGMPAAAITDHGNLYGATHFYKECQSVGIKPIIGCEVYVCHDHTDRESDRARLRHHLILLARNNEGYHNLVRLVTHGFLDGFHYKPRVDKSMLRQYAGGLIALSACMAGEIPRALTRGDMDAALSLTREYASIYPGHFYLELQQNGLAKQDSINTGLLEIAAATNLPLVATNDCHYLNADDADAHDVLLCVQTQSTVDDPQRLRFETRDLYYKSVEEMAHAFAHAPDALENTLRIADACHVSLQFDTHFFPVYALPQGVTPEEEFCGLAEKGLEKRIEHHPERDTLDTALYRARLRHELDIICAMGFSSYFLIVQDFINWAKNTGIPVGPGRGSAAGSLVAWALRITNLDPLPYNLLFERFLNSERVSLPDIDVDFCERRRADVIRYMVEKYGEDAVAQITTFGKMKAKAVVRDVGRALGMSFAATDRIAKLVPEDLKITLQKALEAEPELARLYKEEAQIARLLDTSMRLEGLSRHASTHAAGLVISDKPMIEYLPLYRGKKGELVTQFDMKMVEKIGLVKFDFLGLRTMTLIQDTLDAITAQGRPAPNLDTLPLTDAATYELYSRGDTDGIFQVESSGMRQYLRQLKPSCFEDIIAMLALYRPGPLGSGMVDAFIKRKHGTVPVTYPLPILEDCLRDTYGVIVYQEQVMQIAQIVAGYTLGEADILRRAMGKKNPEAMAKERSTFVNGATEKGIATGKAHEIFDIMEKFAEYGFNKSHSAAYALISYHTAYLKAHHKVEFMAALLTSEMGNQDKLLKYVASCKDMGIDVLPPSVNRSQRAFSAYEGAVVFGLGGIKNVGDEAIREIVEAREQGGVYVSLLDMACRIHQRKVTKRVFESLIKGGACDDFCATRAALLASVDPAVSRAQRNAKDKAAGQVSLFSMAPVQESVPVPGVGFECPEATLKEMDQDQLLRAEKEALGFFLTSHPLLPLRREMERLNLIQLEDVHDMGPGTSLRCGVLVTSVREVTTRRNNERMAFVGVEDLTGHAEVIFFPKSYDETTRALCKSEQPLYLEAHTDKRGDDTSQSDEEDDAPRDIKLQGTRLTLLTEACLASARPVHVSLAPQHRTHEHILALRHILEQYPGPVAVHVHTDIDGHRCILHLGTRFTVLPGPALEESLRQWTEGSV